MTEDDGIPVLKLKSSDLNQMTIVDGDTSKIDWGPSETVVFFLHDEDSSLLRGFKYIEIRRGESCVKFEADEFWEMMRSLYKEKGMNPALEELRKRINTQQKKEK